ncbi:XRE family transcriptional regulator [Salinarimonas ramus]|nr:XRE family transcriptional regulator [Salinarimonas ramus]
MSAERRRRNEAATRDMLREMTLDELREARKRSQAELASVLGVGQPAVAKMERRADMYVSNLRRYVEALGGRLEITARFDDTEVAITNFEDLATKETASSE